MEETRKITCKSFLDEMTDYLDGDLPRDLRASLEAHLAKCPECWVVLDETRHTVEIVQNFDCHPLPEDVKGRLIDAIEKRWDQT